MDKIKVKLPVIFVSLAVLVFLVVIYKTFVVPEMRDIEGPLKIGVKPTSSAIIPTKTPEEVKIISEMKTGQVNISDSEITPQNISVKLHDQIQFFNKSSKLIKVAGESWGGVPLSPGENMTQAFDTAGTFAYSVSELSLTGKVTVE